MPQEYITTTMGLAVFLNLNGHTHQRLEKKGKKCAWVFTPTGNFFDLLDEYFNQGNEFLVEGAIDHFGSMRSEMLNFLFGARTTGA